MRSVSLLILVELLTVLLVTTSPIGTGSGVHHDQLLDSLFPHVHLADGRIVQDDSTQPSLEPTSGPVLGSAAGASAASVGAGLLPILALVFVSPPRPLLRRLMPANQLAPTVYHEAPPDPPPSAYAA